MFARIITTITKKPEDDWSGKLFHHAKTLSSPPDDRDLQSALTEEIKNTIYSTHVNHNKTAEGYLGWDRFYVGENQVQYILYFDTEVNAYLHLANTADVAKETYQPMIKELEKVRALPAYTHETTIDAIDTLPTRS
jgi:hypothetical protein